MLCSPSPLLDSLDFRYTVLTNRDIEMSQRSFLSRVSWTNGSSALALLYDMFAKLLVFHATIKIDTLDAGRLRLITRQL